ncbi:NAD(P)-binding protein [Microthyrium microscopicum]|uniref:NAD(P)-binding protein n=1 Tax=Microthyrium microscopicum TaxID=703497 RepID=A0A6A6U0P2_9PEZI|nr:NAD(P)-binding protein [Microthyrium microscopicum]
MSLADKVILITGASKGIGAAIATRLAKDGASVIINYSSNPAPANALVKTLGEDHAIAVKADVSTIAGIEELIKCSIDRFGRIDAVIANAGVMPMRTVGNTTEEDFDKTFALNVKGPYFLVQKAVPHMKPGSRVIFVSTGVVHQSNVMPPYLLYASTKGAIEQMTKFMSKDLGTKGINVNAIAPGPTGTDLFFEGKSEEMLNMIKSQNPYNRLGSPEDIANATAFFCGSDSSWVNGQVLMANGGMMA